MSQIFIPLVVLGHQDARCTEKLGKLRCDGTASIPVNMEGRAKIRSGIDQTEVIKFTCGHTHKVTAFDAMLNS